MGPAGVRGGRGPRRERKPNLWHVRGFSWARALMLLFDFRFCRSCGVLTPGPQTMRESPTNYFLLAIFTVAEASLQMSFPVHELKSLV